ncbi:MAG: hypothetical protein FWD09_06810 [Lentimicrobiaceae bacterium]|nr:hypothetical protein [Lentimicrobiaceae bacterium]
MNHTLFSCKFKILILFSLLACLCTFSYGQSSVEVIKIDTLPAPKIAPPQTLPKFRIGAQIGYDFFVSKYLAIGLQLSMTLGALNSMNVTVDNVTEKQTLAQRETLNHIAISLGFRFYK